VFSSQNGLRRHDNKTKNSQNLYTAMRLNRYTIVFCFSFLW